MGHRHWNCEICDLLKFVITIAGGADHSASNSDRNGNVVYINNYQSYAVTYINYFKPAGQNSTLHAQPTNTCNSHTLLSKVNTSSWLNWLDW